MSEQETAEKTGLTWRAARPGETVAKLADGTQLRIKQSIGKTSNDTFWYCYNGHRYLGVEKNVDLAKARAKSGRMRMPAADLEEWLDQHGANLPDDLLKAERARLDAWKKDPKPAPRLIQGHPNPLPVPARDEAAGTEPSNGGRKSARAAKSETVVDAPRRATAKGERPTGRLPQDHKVVVLTHDYTGKDGTKWRERQKHVFACDGKLVRDIKDDDALKNMIRDGQIELRGR